jgi:lipid-A-disaccharide synthase
MFIRSGWNVLRTLRQIDREFQTHPPDLAILVDNAGINFRILSMARKHGIPVLYYVPPEFWSVWSVEWRGVLRAKPTIAAIFPSQADSYRRLGLETQWIGHPIIDLTDRLPTAPRRVSTNPVISIFPGSRRQEVRQLLDPMLEAAQLIHEKERSARFVVCAANPMTREMILPKLKQWNLPIECRYRQTHSVLSESHLALACSGTVTLEAALLGVPMVAMYRLGSMMDNIVQQVFLPRSKHPFFALPNVLLNRPVVPELVNQDVQGRIIADRAAPLLRDPSRRNSVLADLARIRPLLGNAGAINRAADLAEQMLTAAQRTKTSAPTRAA